MPVVYRPGSDIFASRAVVKVNPVNCVGVMGAGLAKAFKTRYPVIDEPYQQACQKGALRVRRRDESGEITDEGTVLCLRIDPKTGERSKTGSMVIANVPTKDHWREDSQLDWIDGSLKKLAAWCDHMKVPSIAIPKLGCGLGNREGNFDWKDVHKLIQDHFGPLAEKGLAVEVLGENPERSRDVATSGDTEEKFTFFFRKQSPFSQWHSVTFTEDGKTFNCAEQYMMYRKAMLFDDAYHANKILETNDPGEHKKLGRAVTGFNPKVWNDNKREIVKDGSRLKFTQNPHLMEKLLATAGTRMVEASPYDRIWGIGLAADDPRAKDPTQWRGQNLLGDILTELRDEEFLVERGHAPKQAASTQSGYKPITVVNLPAMRKSGEAMDNVVDLSRYSKHIFEGLDAAGQPVSIKLGNPFPMKTYRGPEGERERMRVIKEFAGHFETLVNSTPGLMEWTANLTNGKQIGCFCAPQCCHLDVVKAASKAHLKGKDPLKAIRAFKDDPQAAHDALRSEDSSRSKAATMTAASEKEAYAGIGSRETPSHVQKKMHEVARILSKDMILRSGGADGADSAFEHGAIDGRGQREIYLPSGPFNGRRPGMEGMIADIPAEAYDIAKAYHPAWHRLEAKRSRPNEPSFPEKLMARNSCQVLGHDLNSPAKVVIAYTEGGKMKGGTAQALRIAQDKGIPIINLGDERWADKTPQQIADCARDPARIPEVLAQPVAKKATAIEYDEPFY